MSAAHRISWWAYAWNNEGKTEVLPRTRSMKAREGWRSWDVVCSCGWKSRTGGALESYIKREIRIHRLLAGL